MRLTAERRQDPVGHMVDSCSTCSNINSPAEDMLGSYQYIKLIAKNILFLHLISMAACWHNMFKLW